MKKLFLMALELTLILIFLLSYRANAQTSRISAYSLEVSPADSFWIDLRFFSSDLDSVNAFSGRVGFDTTLVKFTGGKIGFLIAEEAYPDTIAYAYASASFAKPGESFARLEFEALREGDARFIFKSSVASMPGNESLRLSDGLSIVSIVDELPIGDLTGDGTRSMQDVLLLYYSLPELRGLPGHISCFPIEPDCVNGTRVEK